jgi:hypothetical protein
MKIKGAIASLCLAAVPILPDTRANIDTVKKMKIKIGSVFSLTLLKPLIIPRIAKKSKKYHKII